jgi:signal transduction protein with GAF and PtsI domain
MTPETRLLQTIDGLLIQAGSTDDILLRVLDMVLGHFNCVTGTIHSLDRSSGLLHLRAQRGIPAVIMDKVARIPVGKGMAGLAAERKAPVQVCNLQTDASGVAKPGARETRMEGSIAAPMLVEKSILRGVIGVAKPIAYEFNAAEQELLLQVGEVIGRHLGGRTKQEVLDHYFIEVRAKLIEVAAFLDRVDRAEGEDDYRIKAFREALKALEAAEPGRARAILLALSDPTTEPIPAAKGKSASGAWPGKEA